MTSRTHTEALRRRLPAEWEYDSAILMAWPDESTDWDYILPEVTRCYRQLIGAIVAERPVVLLVKDIVKAQASLVDLVPNKNLFFKEIEYNDTWARDFGPITIEEDGSYKCLDFKFNGWGLKFAACHDNLINLRLSESSVITAPLENHLGFVLEGGSIESDGQGTLFTTSECLLSPNRNGQMARVEIEQCLKDAFGLDRVLWIEHGYLAGDDTDSHIDTLVRIAPNETLIYVKCDDPDDEHYEALGMMERQLAEFRTTQGQPYNLVSLPMPDKITCEGERLPATYANFLVTPTSVFYPTYRQQQKDILAGQILKIVFPNHNIVGIDCLPLIMQHGSLHCVTMQLPREILPI